MIIWIPKVSVSDACIWISANSYYREESFRDCEFVETGALYIAMKEEIHCCLRTAQEVTLLLTEWLSQWATFYFGTYKKTLQSHSRHLWDIDNSFDNWKPEVVTIIVTWQLRVTLDIRKSKILTKTYLQWENADDFKDKLLQFKAVREAPNNNKTGNLGTIDPNLWNHPPTL